MGYVNNQPNNSGSAAKIYTVNPNLGCCGYRASFVLILSLGDIGGGISAFVQSGIAKTINGGCGSPVVFIAEYIDRVPGDPHNGVIKQHCEMAINPVPGTDHTYTSEYDPATGYWCHDYDGICRYSEPRVGGTADIWPVGYDHASQVAAYGETNDNTVQLGSTFQQTVISQIQYKNAPNQTFYFFTTPPYTPGGYSPCDANCPTYHRFSSGASGDGNKWFVQIWTA
ncbi:MAG TPA: hypothetical protein VH186_29860 [Chloroflexia bacterium]|nr:hypothetical protein [Chloroflexia bacterium]